MKKTSFESLDFDASNTIINTLTSTDPTPVSTWHNLKNSFKRQPGNPELNQTLKKRQLRMISLASCIGSGLFIGGGSALKVGGAGGVLIGWAIVSVYLYCVMQSLAEMVAVLPISGSFAAYSSRFVDPSWGFAVGWNYALFWVVVLPLELVASAMTIKFWPSAINPVVWVAVFYVLIILLNLCGNKGFGEAEFVSAVIKLLAIVGFNILAIVIICGGTDAGFIGARYWHHPGPFANGAKGTISVLITAVYSLAGTELIGLTASESKGNPRTELPHAIKLVFYRIVVFYMVTLTLVGFLVPWNSDQLVGSSSSDASASPFVIAINSAGIKVLPSIFNVVVLIALLAIGNSAVYGFSRTILSLAQQGLAPRIFMYVDRAGRPLMGILVAAVVGLLAFVSATPDQEVVFAWLMALSGLSTLFTWASVSLVHLRFRMGMKAQGRGLDELPYLANTGVGGAIVGLVTSVVILVLQFWISLYPVGRAPNAKVFFQNYLGAVVVLVFFVGHKLYSRKLNAVVRLHEMDLDSGRRELDFELMRQVIETEKEELRMSSWYRRMWRVLF
ncbi:hypothetical protein PSN45_005109 [Yamadazyma tenuis]|uniref:Amino acid permease/ SLC12A domain-containing protein n=1 Tax=Candida tenuis (strain ATCC 10573 / BCRC 21748 / CBS 615 / JCM 9827 / NBRC 10315 / NRRL Y-1498 / VKM Y-70) TaxID=590646 RepID=G3B2U3_CANTC|nr:uncharacterized protein CANTEDRAFT_134074 [Yamadazyma tenuis ATCC 10573]EGV64763.1 hypothetical protein CANTEDRAFT_134074 [Yamadazyma tenuis ATCC 10573]WEJ97554.1 hypothetical protein PSN45_005109 [Yamadazyma tenuis]